MRIDLRWTKAELRNLVDIERDRRMAGGIIFNGVKFQTRDGDRENIAGASTLALAAIMAGSQAGNLRWHGGPEDFAWIAADNSLVPMDAQTVIAFGTAVANYKERLYRAARTIKDLEPVPRDYADDGRWPEG